MLWIGSKGWARRRLISLVKPLHSIKKAMDRLEKPANPSLPLPQRTGKPNHCLGKP